MRFASLGSGSSGNATVIQLAGKTVMLDCGFALRETVRRLGCLNLTPTDIDAIVVTHEHSDHIKGVGPFARKHNTPVYLTPGTYSRNKTGDLPRCQLIENYNNFDLGALSIQPVPVPHDAREPAQFIFDGDGIKIGVLTDLGSITPKIIDAFGGCDALLVEANHDLDLLARGPYPASVKARVSGAWGHLNNQQARTLIEQLDLSKMQHLVVGHISTKNNSLEAVEGAFIGLDIGDSLLHYATQSEGFSWLAIEKASKEDALVKQKTRVKYSGEPYNLDLFDSHAVISN